MISRIYLKFRCKVFANEEDGESEQKEKGERDAEDEEEEEEISPEKLKEIRKLEDEKRRRRKIVNRFVRGIGTDKKKRIVVDAKIATTE